MLRGCHRSIVLASMVMHPEWWGSGAAVMIAVLVGESMACTSTVWNARGYIGCSGEGGGHSICCDHKCFDVVDCFVSPHPRCTHVSCHRVCAGHACGLSLKIQAAVAI